jgi:hypothetical protein
MSVTDHLSRVPGAVVASPLSLCLAALALLFLSGAPAAQAAPCAPGLATPGCDGAMRPPVQANARPSFWPLEHPHQPDPCAPGMRHDDMPACNAVPTGAVVQGVMSLMQMMAPPAQQPH